jgi:hypothetical protein
MMPGYSIACSPNFAPEPAEGLILVVSGMPHERAFRWWNFQRETSASELHGAGKGHGNASRKRANKICGGDDSQRRQHMRNFDNYTPLNSSLA